MTVVDTAPLRPPSPWDRAVFTPALIRWRIVGLQGEGEAVGDCDRRSRAPAVGSFFSMYATGTRQNRPHRSGLYCVYLAHGWTSAAMADGDYVLEVQAVDVRGNVARGARPLEIAKGA